MRLNLMIRFAVASAVAVLALTGPASASSIEIGSTAPALELTAADGSQRSLTAGDGPKLLIFYRGLW